MGLLYARLPRLHVGAGVAIWSWLFGKSVEQPESQQTGAVARPSLPTVRFDPSLVTQDIIDDIRAALLSVPEFRAVPFDPLFDAAVAMVTAGGNAPLLYRHIVALNLPRVDKEHASAVTRWVEGRARALIDRNRCINIGLKEAVWHCSAAPCYATRHPTKAGLRQNAAHQSVDGKTYKIAEGMKINGKWTHPGVNRRGKRTPLEG